MSNSGVIIILTIGIVFMGLLYGVTNYPLDFMTSAINQQTDMGIRSEDSLWYINLMMSLWRFAPVAIVLGSIVYVYEVSKGSDLGAAKFFEYSVLLYACSFLGIILMWAWSMGIDFIFDSLLARPEIGNVDPMWDQSWVVRTLMDMGYVMLTMLSIVPIILMVAFPILYQRDNTFFDVDEGEGGEGGSTATDNLIFNPKQW